MKKAGFVLLTVFLVIIGCLCFATTANSQEKEEQRFECAYYKEMEKEYKEKLRAVLEGELLYNSGIAITHMTEEDRSRSYRIVIHHKRIDRMGITGKKQLLKALNAVPFPDSDCNLHIEFLTYENS